MSKLGKSTGRPVPKVDLEVIADQPVPVELVKVETDGEKKRLRTVLAVLEPLSVAGFFIFLLWQTWFRWSDPLIDFPRDLYYAWRISDGDLLYERLANWYGPLANLVEGAGFRLFGAGYDTLIWMNITLTVGALLLLRGIFGAIGNRLTVWLSSIAFLGIFAFGHYGVFANYNFITPYVAQSTYTFLGVLLVLWGLLKQLKSGGGAFWFGVTGFGLAVTYLDKPEGLLAAGGAIGICFLGQAIHSVRHGVASGRWLAHALSWLVGGFLCLWLPVLVFFYVQGGAAYAFKAANYTVVAFFDPAIKDTIAHDHLLQVYSGFDQPGKNFMFELRQGTFLALFWGAIIAATSGWSRRPKYSLGWWLWGLVAIVAATGCAWFSYQFPDLGPELAFPVCVTAVVVCAWCFWLAWRGGAGYQHWLGVSVVGTAAGLMLARMILNARVLHYGFFMMPLAWLFLTHMLVVEAVKFKPNTNHKNWLLPALVAGLILLCTATLLDTSLTYYKMKTYAVGTGRDRFYTFPPQAYTTGEFLNVMVAAVKDKTPGAKTLAAFPEGIAVNYHLRLPTSLRELEFNPIALAFIGPQSVIADLRAHPPGAILLFYRDYSEYDAPNFGAEGSASRGITDWIGGQYTRVFAEGVLPESITGNAIDLLAPVDAQPQAK